MRDGKKPKAAYSPRVADKVPRQVEDPLSFHKEYPVWRMGKVDVGCEHWGWNLIDGATMHRIREKLASYETMTFREILNKDATGCHDVDIYQMIPKAQARVEAIKLTRDSLFSLRITGKERVWGIRTNHVIELLWWDPEHEVCPATKRNT